MARLLQAAHALLMPRLVTHCEAASPLPRDLTLDLALEVLSLAELLERPRLFRAAALCVLEHASSSTPPELIDHVLAGLEARTAPQSTAPARGSRRPRRAARVPRAVPPPTAEDTDRQMGLRRQMGLTRQRQWASRP